MVNVITEQRSCGKVISSEAYVCSQEGRVGYLWSQVSSWSLVLYIFQGSSIMVKGDLGVGYLEGRVSGGRVCRE